MTELPMEHIDRDQCDEYVLGRGTDVERRIVETHVSFCAPCAELLREARVFIATFRETMED